MPIKEKRSGRKVFRSHTSRYGLNIEFSTKRDRYFVRASGPVDDLDGKADQPPTKWKVLYANRKFRLYGTTSTRDTDYSVQGQNVFMIITQDKRKFRIYPNDFTHESLTAIQKIMKELNNFR